MTYQITFHNLWICVTAIGSAALYGILFWKIRTHYKGEGNILRRSSIVLPPPSSPSTISSMSASQSNLSSASKRQRVGKRGLRTVARTMLVYPITYIAYSIPLTVLSIINNQRRSTSHPVLVIVLSALFALRGAIDVLAFGMTRNVIILRTPPTPGGDEESSLAPSSPHSFQKPKTTSSASEKSQASKDFVGEQFVAEDGYRTIELQLPQQTRRYS